MILTALFALVALASPAKDGERFAFNGDLAQLQALHAARPLDLARCCLPAAFDGKQAEVVTWILGQGVDANAEIPIANGRGTRPVLISAIFTREAAIIHAALDAGADPRVVYRELGALAWTVNTLSREDRTVLARMIEGGADPNDATGVRITAMDLACTNRNGLAMARLASRGGALGSSVCQEALKDNAVGDVLRSAGLLGGPPPADHPTAWNDYPAALPPLPPDERARPRSDEFARNVASAEGANPHPDAARWRLWQEVARGVGLFDEDLLAWRAVSEGIPNLSQCSPSATRCEITMDTQNVRLCVAEAVVVAVEVGLLDLARIDPYHELRLRCTAIEQGELRLSTMDRKGGVFEISIGAPGNLGGLVTLLLKEEPLAWSIRDAKGWYTGH